MALTSQITKHLEIPDEPGQRVTIRKLSHHQLMMAHNAKISEAAEQMRLFQGLELPTPNEDAPDDTPEQRIEKAEARRKAKAEAELPASKYQRTAVLKYGLIDWTYQAAIDTGVEELDEDTAAWLFDEIISFSIRSADEKKASANGSRPITGPAAPIGQSN